uniref:Major histocompatibility complex class I-related gene protein-like n=1 Tax=Neolamprologus brichardi TaxID=32507 RepID=A0A3Q4G7D1_NEOBR
ALSPHYPMSVFELHLSSYSKSCFWVHILPAIHKIHTSMTTCNIKIINCVHILQKREGCEWNEKTGKVTGFLQYGYNGEGFLDFDLKTLTWIALKREAAITKQEWDADSVRTNFNENLLTNIYPEWIKKFLSYGKIPPSVSLLQKSSSSPVSCHATGFYPDRAVMFWRKDGEEISEGVDPGEILPNHDGTFQISVDLNVSLVKSEDWRRYDCVFQFSDVENNTSTKLDKAVIRTNRGKNKLSNDQGVSK